MSKKSFTESALMQFITPEADAQPVAQTAEATAPAQEMPQITRQATEHKAPMDLYEPRSRRVQLLMRPSIFTGIQHIAKKNHQSTNNLIETILADYIAKIKATEG